MNIIRPIFLIVKFFYSQRSKYIPNYFTRNYNSIKMGKLFNSDNTKILKNLALFSKEIMPMFK